MVKLSRTLTEAMERAARASGRTVPKEYEHRLRAVVKKYPPPKE